MYVCITYVCMYVSMYVCMYVCVYVCMYVSNLMLRCAFAKEARLIRSLSTQLEKEAVY